MDSTDVAQILTNPRLPQAFGGQKSSDFIFFPKKTPTWTIFPDVSLTSTRVPYPHGIPTWPPSPGQRKNPAVRLWQDDVLAIFFKVIPEIPQFFPDHWVQLLPGLYSDILLNFLLFETFNIRHSLRS